jgi:hypothetical protein
MRKLIVLALLLFAAGRAISAQTAVPTNPLVGNINVQDAGTCSTANSYLLQLLPQNASTTTVNLGGTFSATVTVRMSNNGSTWTTVGTQSSAGTASYSPNGFLVVCADVTSYSSGAVQVSIMTGTGVSNSGSAGGTTPTWPTANTDSGVANAYVTTVPFTNGCAALTIGCGFLFTPAHANSGASTLNVNGTGITALTDDDGRALGGGEIVANPPQPYLFFYDGHQYILSGSRTGYGPTPPGSPISLQNQVLGCVANQAAGASNAGCQIDVHAYYTSNGLTQNRQMICATSGGSNAQNDLCLGFDNDGFSILSSISQALCICTPGIETFGPLSIFNGMAAASHPSFVIGEGITQTSGDALQVANNNAAVILNSIDAVSGAPTSNETVGTGLAAGISGTGACLTTSTQKGGTWAGSITCTGTTGASTLVITPGGTAAANGWGCSGSDTTSGHELALPQSGVSVTTCTLKASSVTASDVLAFNAWKY